MPRWTALVAFVVGVRVLGIALVLPGFPAHGAALGGTPLATGLAFGAYGLTMALLQVPLGAVSDRWGRRPALVAGLAVAAAGSVLAAWAPTIGWLVAARLLQGAGAVNGVALALLAERVPEAGRTTALAWTGASAGAAFVGGVALGAAALHAVDLPALFLVNAALNAVALGLVAVVVPGGRPEARAPHLRDVLHASSRPRVLALDGAGFALNLALHAVLFAFPSVAAASFGEAGGRTVLALVVLAGGGAMFGLARRADRGRLPQVVGGALALLPLAAALVLVAGSAMPVALVVGGVLFFAAQATLAASLPSLAARLATSGRGSVQGSLQTAQYLGVFAGGALAGALVASPWALAALLAAASAAALVAARRTGLLTT